MKKKKRVGTLFLVMSICISIGMTAFGWTKSYSVGDSYYLVLASYTPYYDGVSLKMDTRPTSGVAGVYIWVAGSNGYSNTQTFPYYTDRNPWVLGVEKNITYTIQCKSVQGTATGNLEYYEVK